MAKTYTFHQDTDYQLLTQHGENPSGGRPPLLCNLSVPCLEQLAKEGERYPASLEIAELTGKNHKEVLRDMVKVLESADLRCHCELGSYWFTVGFYVRR